MRRVTRLLTTALAVAGCAHKTLIQEETEGFVAAAERGYGKARCSHAGR
jgi:hypothetical protein